MDTVTTGLLLSPELIKWIEDDDRITVEFDEENDVIITTFIKDRYIFENRNLSDRDYLRTLDITKHNVEEPEAKKNIKKLILEAQYFLETSIALHDFEEPKTSENRVVEGKIYRF